MAEEMILLKDVIENLSDDSIVYIFNDTKKINTFICTNSLDFQVAFRPKTLSAKVYENKEVIAFRIDAFHTISPLIEATKNVAVVLKDCEV